MKSQVWSGFTPSVSKVENFHGGLMLDDPSGNYDIESTKNFHLGNHEVTLFSNKATYFMALSYDLIVSDQHDGWHHYMSFHTNRGGEAYGGGLIKTACSPGVYKILLHFQTPIPRVGGNQGKYNLELTLLGTLRFGVNAKVNVVPFGINNSDVHKNVFACRPKLLDPNSVYADFKLYDPGQFNGDTGGEGFPISYPENTNPY